MAEQQTFRERLPIVAKMIDSAFNGDRKDDADRVSFCVIAYEGADKHEFAASMISNIAEQRELICLLLSIIAESAPPPGPVGHA